MPPSTDPAAVAWRRHWRIRGLAADRMCPIAFGQPSPSLDELASFVPRSVVLPTGTRHSLGQDDRDAALLFVKFAMAFIAEYLPVQVVMTDLRSELPGVATQLAFLIYRPPGFTVDGRSHRGGFGFVAFDADKLCQWSPGSQNNPDYMVMNGTLFQNCVFEPLEPAALPPFVLRAPQRDRWAELRQLMVKPGWVKVRDFVFVIYHTGLVVHKMVDKKDLGVADDGENCRHPP